MTVLFRFSKLTRARQRAAHVKSLGKWLNPATKSKGKRWFETLPRGNCHTEVLRE